MISHPGDSGLTDEQVAVAYLLAFFLEQNNGTGRISKKSLVQSFSIVGSGSLRLTIEEDPDQDLILRAAERGE